MAPVDLFNTETYFVKNETESAIVQKPPAGVVF